MSELSVGKDVISQCGTCKLALSHLIVAMNQSGSVAKVKCQTCGNIHRFRDPAAPKKRKSALGKSRSSKSKSEIPLQEIWQKAIDKATETKKYNIRSKFEIGDVLAHPKFGDGLVESLVDNDKITVIFQSQLKTLVHNR